MKSWGLFNRKLVFNPPVPHEYVKNSVRHVRTLHKGIYKKMNNITSTYGYLYQFVIMPNPRYLHDYRENMQAFAKRLRILCGMQKAKVHHLETAEDHVMIIAELPPRLYRHKFTNILKSSSYKFIIEELCPNSPCLLEKDFWIKANVERSYIPEHPERNITAIADFLNANRITPQSADEADATGDTEVNQQPE